MYASYMQLSRRYNLPSLKPRDTEMASLPHTVPQEVLDKLMVPSTATLCASDPASCVAAQSAAHRHLFHLLPAASAFDSRCRGWSTPSRQPR